jgi:hypothetical protein
MRTLEALFTIHKLIIFAEGQKMALRDKQQTFTRFYDLVAHLNQEKVERSETDITRLFLDVLEAIGISTVLDTNQHGSRKRPDILGYINHIDADLVFPAEIVGEVKKPEEIQQLGGSILAALTGALWKDKFIPYVRTNAARIQYFILTSIIDTAFVRITPDIRQRLTQLTPEELLTDEQTKDLVISATTSLSLFTLGTPVEALEERNKWEEWVTSHLSSTTLNSFSLLDRANTIPIDTPDSLENFTFTLARLVAGVSSTTLRGGKTRNEYRGIFEQIASSLPMSLSNWTQPLNRDFLLYIMSADPSLDTNSVQQRAINEFVQWRESFIAASIHSLVSRLFILKIIEDRYCQNQKKPLIEPDLWVLNTNDYEDKRPEEVLTTFQQKLDRLRKTQNTVIRHITVFGGFFNWIENYIDPTTFTRLLELFIVHNFELLASDLLGHFYEMYAQEVNRTQRKALGQYFTPLPIVEYMWSAVFSRLQQTKIPLDTVEVLDPATGSATFLAQAAHQFGSANVPQFWTKLVGFDIAAQSQGIAQANLYMAVLSQVAQEKALDVSDLRLFTTDTLDLGNANYLGSLIAFMVDPDQRSYLERQVELSHQIKRQSSFRVVIGNPPYLGHSRFSLKQMANRFPRLLASSSQAARAQQALIRDDYAWFFAAADFYLEHQGLLCFITSDSYTRLGSYKYFRQELMRHFHVVSLIYLGANVFPDVGPRIHFSIILLEKREKALESLERSEPFPYYNLSSLVTQANSNKLSGPNDPRFLHLINSARDHAGKLEWSTIQRQESKPVAERDFIFLPLNELGNVLHERFHNDTVFTYLKTETERLKADHIFKKKWPGIVTTFDRLLHDKSRTRLEARMQAFFELATYFDKLGALEQERRVQEFVRNHNLDNTQRLIEALQIASRRGMLFEKEKIDHTVSGTLNTGVMWYPDESCTSWLYFEPLFRFERPKQPEGKIQGWGSQSQWRDPLSHDLLPKLVYTVSNNPSSIASHGYRAFVLDDHWYVRMAGAASQQYHYTGISQLQTPIQNHMLDEKLYDNLTKCGLDIVKTFEEAGGTAEDLLFFIAAIYNSELAAEYHFTTSSEGLGIKRVTPRIVEECLAIARIGHQLRDLHRLLAQHNQFIAPGKFTKTDLEALAPASLLETLGVLSPPVEVSSLYRVMPHYELSHDFWTKVRTMINSSQKEIDTLVEDLYET